MADLVLTAASVLKGAGASIQTKYANAAIAAGQVVYVAADFRVGLCDANSVTPEIRIPAGIALNAAQVGHPVAYQNLGQIALGAVLAVGQVYVVSANPGGIAPVSDLATGHYVALLGVASTTSVLNLDINYSGIVKP